MISFIIVICLLWILYKITSLMFHIAGKFLGFLFGSIGYLFLGVLAIAVLGLAFYALPLIILAGIGLLCAASK